MLQKAELLSEDLETCVGFLNCTSVLLLGKISDWKSEKQN